MVYVQGMIAPIAKTQKEAFTKAARKAAVLFKKAGALAVVDGWGFDLPVGKVNDFRTAVKTTEDETVLFSYIVWPDKAAGDAGMEQATQDPFFQTGDFGAGMDMQRMIFGGFEPIVSEGPFNGFDYIDGFLLAVPQDNKADYKKMADEGWPFFDKFGAQSMYECWGVDVPDGVKTSMPMAVMKTPEEQVVFSWIGWTSEDARSKGQERMMNDPEMKPPEVMPFDGSRMIYGGFEVVSDA